MGSRGTSRKVKRGWVWIGDFLVGALCFVAGLLILRSVAPASPEVLLPGTALTVHINSPLTSQTARLGDTFEAQVDSARGVSGPPPLPPNARVEGRCVAVRAGQPDGRPGYLRLALSGLWDAQGHFSALETTTVSLSGKRSADAAEDPSSVTPSAVPLAEEVTVKPGNSREAVITADDTITFVLLKPAVLPVRR